MESNFYKASLRPMGASAPTYSRACSSNRPMLCIWIVPRKINKLYQIRPNELLGNRKRCHCERSEAISHLI